MGVFNPLKVIITNFSGDCRNVEVADFPGNEESKKHTIPFSSVLYIERDDYCSEHSKDFYRLTPSQAVGLKYISEGNISFKKEIKNAKGELVAIEVELVPKKTKVRSHIQWVSSSSPDELPLKITARLYENLLLVDDATTVPNWLDAINPNSLRVVDAFVDPSLATIEGDHVQFERVGYFYRDPDSTKNRQVWNSTVLLKQDKAKK